MQKSYITGTYIMRSKKIWDCLCCNEKINIYDLYFNRMEEFGDIKINKKGEEYRNKKCDRYHVSCAKENLNLSKIEIDLLKEYKDKLNPKERDLQKQVSSYLKYREQKNDLFYTKNYVGKMKSVVDNKEYKLGRKGFPDLSVFLNNGIVLFIELKTKDKKLNENQELFKNKITNLNYKYFNINSLSQLTDIRKHYN